MKLLNYGTGTLMAVDTKATVQDKLAPGMYKASMDDYDRVVFDEINHTHDKLIDLPDAAYFQALSELEAFLTPETKAKFDKFGKVYKRSFLFFGDPGTGKTSIINRLAREVIGKGGVVLFDPSPYAAREALETLEKIQPETLTMVIFEEIDNELRGGEGTFLSLLDGETQKGNVVFVAATNFIDRIPKRILRPGRFASVLEVSLPSEAARSIYITRLLSGDEVGAARYLPFTTGLTLDEISEMVVSSECFGTDLQVVHDKLLQVRTYSSKQSMFQEDTTALNQELAKLQAVQSYQAAQAYQAQQPRAAVPSGKK